MLIKGVEQQLGSSDLARTKWLMGTGHASCNPQNWNEWLADDVVLSLRLSAVDATRSRLVEQVIPSSTTYPDTLQQITNYFTAHGSSLAQAHDQAIQWIGAQVQTTRHSLATWMRSGS